MSLKNAVLDLIEHLKSGAIIEGFNKYYAQDVVMQENNLPPTKGHAANLEREKQFLASVKEWKGLNISASAVEDEGGGNGVSFIEYDFDFINTDDEPVHYEQVSVQRWKNGRIASERFYYDTGA